MEQRSPSQRTSKSQHPQYLKCLHHEKDIIKEAQRRVSKGDPLPKDMYNTVMKWSKRETKAEDVSQGGGQRKEKRQSTSHSGHKKESSDRDLEKEEEELRRELRNMRELTQSNIYLLEENKRLMRKVQRLRQRVKRQGEAGRGSRESVEAPRDDVILSLKKKYEDLLQYVLKVEAENQKLNSLIGVSGECRGSLNDMDHETTRQTITDLQKEIQTLRGQLMEKDECLGQYEQHLRTVKDNNLTLQESLNKQGTGYSRKPEMTVLEEEWMRQFSETREMYEEAIQGYKNQLEQTQRKLVEEEQEHAHQVEELRQQLEKIQSEVRTKDTNGLEGERKKVMEVPNHARQGEAEREELEGSPVKTKGSPRCQKSELSTNNTLKDMGGNDGNASQNGAERNFGSDTYPQAAATDYSRNGEGKAELVTVTRVDKMHGEALELIVRRLENLQVGGEEVESMMGVIKDTINNCLQEWRDSFHQDRAQLDKDRNQLQAENEQLQRKLRGRNQKIDALQKQSQDFQRQNDQLLHQRSLLESRMASLQATEQLGILSGLPQKVQEVEQQLADTKELLHQTQVENQGLQSQVKHLEEKLGKKECKLRAEREQSVSREREVAGARESASSLQHQLEEITREISQLRDQLSTKDAILEHTSAQLEERIRECASLSAIAERYKLQQNQDSDRIQTHLSERETTSHKHFLEAQAQASRFQAQLSALRTEKEHNEKSLRATVRKLEEQVDQLQLRNSTLQRQLNTFTSTYHTLFSGVDHRPVTTSTIDTSGLKGM